VRACFGPRKAPDGCVSAGKRSSEAGGGNQDDDGSDDSDAGCGGAADCFLEDLDGLGRYAEFLSDRVTCRVQPAAQDYEDREHGGEQLCRDGHGSVEQFYAGGGSARLQSELTEPSRQDPLQGPS